MPKPDKPDPVITVNPTTYTPGRLKLITVNGQNFPNIKRVNIYAIEPGEGEDETDPIRHDWGWAQPKNGGLSVTEELILVASHPSEKWSIQATDEDGTVLATATLNIG